MSDKLEILKKHLAKIDEVIANGEYKDNWDSLKNHPVPQWYQKAKLGIFIHWGVYAVPSFGSEWYPYYMHREGKIERGNHVYQHHIDTYGKHKDFGYKDFIPMFTAPKFNAAEWAELFKEAGAKFIMPVAEHHDGFPMYDCELTDWCATKMGPKKDIVGELKAEVEKRDMVLTASSHRVEHYWFMSGAKKFDSGMPQEPEYSDLYWPSTIDPFEDHTSVYDVTCDELFMQDWLARTCEIVDKYQPKIVYFDWWIQIKPMKPYLKKFAAYYYNRAKEWGAEVTINYKNDAFMHTVGVRDIERGQLADISPWFWQNDTAVALNSWCYTVGNQYKKTHEIIADLVDVVSKNGSLLLNVGPHPDGSIPKEDADILKEIGAWLKVNGEAIYETIPWRKYGEGPTVTEEGHFTDTLREPFTSEDFRFTFKDGSIYVFAMKWPEDGVVRIKALGERSALFNAVIESVEVLGAETCDFTLCKDYLSVYSKGITTDKPVCIKITTD